jgi:hypothetical protein
MPVFRGFPDANVVAIFDEPNQIGSIDDIDAPRNSPAKSPHLHMGSVYWHVDFFQYELAQAIQTVSVSHSSLAGAVKYWGPVNEYWISSPVYTSAISYEVPGQVQEQTRTLVTHNLGYVPPYFIAYDNKLITSGVFVQSESDGRSRFVSPFATTTTIGLKEVMTASKAALPAVSRSYTVVIFRVPTVVAGAPLFGRHGDGIVIGRGKIDTSKNYFRRVVSSGTPFSLNQGRTIDISNGRTRVVSGGVATTEPGYNGSFSGPGFVSVGV